VEYGEDPSDLPRPFARLRERLKAFRCGLIREYQHHWDELIVQAHQHAHAAGQQIPSSRTGASSSPCSSLRRNASPNSRPNWRATTDDSDDQLYPEFIEDFKKDWYQFRGLLPPNERENWDILVEQVEE